MHRPVFRPILAIMAVLTSIGCSTDDVAVDRQYSDREVYAGTVFGVGELVDDLGLDSPRQILADDASFAAYVDRAWKVTDQIAAEDPKFLSRYSAAIKSGDLYAMKRVLQEGRDKAEHSVQLEIGTPPDEGACVAVAAAVAVVLVVWKYVWRYSSDPVAGGESELRDEQFLLSLSKAFHPESVTAEM